MLDQPVSLEHALDETERAADSALKAAEKVVGNLRQLKHAAQQGEVRKLHGSNDALRQSFETLEQEVANAADSWQFDEEGYLRGGAYAQELLQQATAQGVQMVEQDDRLYCYPMLITVDPGRRAVSIDRRPERRLRPSVLVNLLRERQKRPPRFKPADFLESLYAAYTAARKQIGRDEGAVITLLDIYTLLTMLPDQRKEYARPEFTRDVHLLDISGVNTTRNGVTVSFDASTGTKSGRGVLATVTENGTEKRYYGISFSKSQGD
ncbi:MAG TPA: hypothetical protein VHB98_14485 [Chloroflexota bacterium]|jgi:hypothetical protein|nr:hypothetical protein [Chloroflexota bacterium]